MEGTGTAMVKGKPPIIPSLLSAMVPSALLAHLPDAGVAVRWESHAVWEVVRKSAVLWVPSINSPIPVAVSSPHLQRQAILLKVFLVRS